MADRKLIVEIVGDSRSLERSFARSQVATGKFSGQMKTVGSNVDRNIAKLTSLSKLFAGGFAAGVAIKGVTDLTAAASDLNEEVSKSNVIFGKSATGIDQWSKTTASAIGVSRTEALRAAATFGSIFTGTGQSVAEAAKLSRALVTLGADLASFNNTTVQDALDALRSGLSGEIEPLRRFQVFLTEAIVAQRAMADSGKKSSSELTQGEKILARYNLILEQTKKQQGDAVRTGNQFAGQQKRLRAELADTRAEMGQRLLPVMLKVTEAGVAIVKSFHGVEVAADALASVDFRQKFANVFGIDELRRVLGELAPQLKEAQQQFVRDIQGVFAEPLKVDVTFEPVVKPGVKGFGTGLKPSDIYGPLIKTIPQALEEALLDAQISGSQSAIRAVLVRILNTMNEALDDPRLKREGRIAIKQIIESTKGQIQSIDEGVAAAAKSAASERASKASKAATALARKWTNIIDALQIGVEAAKTDVSLKNDLTALLALKRGLDRQIKAGIDIANAVEQRDKTIQEIGETRKGLEQQRQFRLIGLSITGEEIVPGIKNLSERIKSALARVSSGELKISSKLTNSLKLAQKAIRTEGKRLTEETRKQINEWIKAANGEDAKNLNLRATSGLNTKKIVEGLGLSPELERIIRARLSHVNTRGIALSGQTAQAIAVAGGPPIVESHITVQLDGEVVGRSVTKSQQKTRRRNPPQKRGPNSGV